MSKEKGRTTADFYHTNHNIVQKERTRFTIFVWS